MSSQGGLVKHSTATRVVIMLLVVSLSPAYFSVPANHVLVQAQPAATISVVHSVLISNITDLSLSPGSTFDVNVNLQNAGQIIGFDVALGYDFVAIGPPCDPLVEERCILDVVSGSLSGGLLDPNNPPSGCNVFVSRFELDQPQGNTRVGAVIVGPCSVDGNGTLFTLTFQVLRVGATTIDIVEADSRGQQSTIIVGQPAPNVPYQAVDAYFRNKPGIPPVADFTFDPPDPVRGQRVAFNATTSRDPYNSTGTDKGIRKIVWAFGDNTAPVRGNFANATSLSHRFVFGQSEAVGSFSVTLVVWDYADNLLNAVARTVKVRDGEVHDVSLSTPALSKSDIQPGEAVEITITVGNRGTLPDPELVNLLVSYNYNGITVVANQTGTSLPRDQSRQFNYTLQTTGLPAPRTYTLTARVSIANQTGPGTIPDAKPADNARNVEFRLLGGGEQTSSLSVPLLAGLVVAVLVAVWAMLYLSRRRRRET